jgi:IclR family acetate operon transcriptional repressor
MADGKALYDVSVLNKALDVVERLAEGVPRSAVELSEMAGIRRTAAYRILGTLERRGYVHKDQRSRRYGVGSELLALSRAIVSSSADLSTVARPVMAALRDAVGETVNLGALSGNAVLYLEMFESDRGLRTTVEVGSHDPLHSTALGRAILAEMPDADARRCLSDGDLVAVTPRTLVEIEALMAEVRASRERGYAIENGENELGARCVGIAIRDGSGRPTAAISVSGPEWRLTEELLPGIVDRLRDAAAAVEAAMGFRSPQLAS